MTTKPQPATIFLVINRKTLETKRAATIEEAVAISEATDAIDYDSMAWAIEEYGRCDGNEWTVIPQEWEQDI